MAKFRKKPVEIDAIQWDGSSHREMFLFLGGDLQSPIATSGKHFYINHSEVVGGLIIKTNEGDMCAMVGDWIIKEPFPTHDRLFYPCKPDIFAKTYDAI